ncbi:MAG: FtsX-like permease family protein [Candidatus Thioglobus sp.]|nr:ABC transporter [Candidatus Neomarinimicrobiota bacterium]MDP7554236.1 FtsX-like permease family protein [Candidatus Thioglobus sp.]
MLDYQQLLFIHRYALRDITRSYKKLWVISTTLFISLLLLSLTFSVKHSLSNEIEANSKELLGGDIQISSGIEPLQGLILEQLSELGQISETVSLATMLSKKGDTSVFVDLRAVDGNYPLYGEMKTIPANAGQELLHDAKRPTVLINENIQNQLRLNIADEVVIMGQDFVVGGVIASVPDLAQSAVFGEFAIINKDQFDEFNIGSRDSFLKHDYRLKLNQTEDDGKQIELIKSIVESDKNINTRLPKDSGQSLRRIIDNFSNFLNLVSVSAMIIAGIGISNTLLSFVNQRNISIAVKKSLGFSSNIIQLIYFYEILLILIFTSILAYCIGVMSPLLANDLIPKSFDIDLQTSFSFISYLNIFFIGLLVVLIFSIPSLYSISAIKAVALFRNTFQPVSLHFSAKNIFYLTLLVVVLVGYFVFQTEQQFFTLLYFMAFVVTIFIFYGVSRLLISLLKRSFDFSSNSYKIAYRNIVAKKSLAPIMTISLGIGLTLLLTLSFVANNLKHEISQSIPSMAPDMFFVSINKGEKDDLESFIKSIDPNVELEFSPMASASFVALNGTPIEEIVSGDNRSSWIVRGDRRISWLEKPNQDNLIVRGEWWEPGIQDQMFVSMDSRAAFDLGMKLNDKITLNILGRDVIGTVKNFRKVDYRDISINFAIIINEAFATKLPYEYIGTLKSELSADTIQSKVIGKFPNISAIKIDRILSKVGEVLNKIFIAVTGISLIVIVIGLIVIVSAVMVQTTFRRYNNLIYKILGVNFPTILKAMTLEFAIIYLTLIIFALTVAMMGSYFVVENILLLSWSFDPSLTLWIVFSTAAVSFLLILIANRNIFNPKVYPLIRNE